MSSRKLDAAAGGGSVGPYELPEGWRWVGLGSLGQFINGAAFKPSDWVPDGAVPIIRIQNLNNPDRPMNRTNRVVDCSLKVKHEDILVSWSASLDTYIWRGEEAWLNQHIFRVIPGKSISNPRYLYYLLKHEIGMLKRSEHLHGSTMMHVNRGPFLAHSVPLPSENVQHELVSHLDATMSEIDDGETALAQARADLEVYRRSLLKAAVTGELTADWRAANPPKETSADLLARILADRLTRWRAEPRNAGRSYRTPTAIALKNHPKPPEGWALAAVEAVGEVALGRQRAPAHHQGSNMRPYLRVANVMEGRLDLRDVKQMNFTPVEFKTFALKPGDVLLAEGQSPEFLGRPAIYRGEIDECCFQKTLLRFRASEYVSPEFAELTFRAYMHTGRFRRESRITTNMAHLTQVRFVAMEFLVPPLGEQVEIVERFQRLNGAIPLDGFDSAAAELRQSILAAAFRGELL